jgi:hypothetical protein
MAHKLKKIFKFLFIFHFFFLQNISNNLFADQNQNYENQSLGKLSKTDQTSGPILDFFGKTFVSFIAKRVDYLILKNGFNDHLKRALNLQSDIKFQILKEGDKNSEKILRCGQIGVFNIFFEDKNHSKINNDFEKEEINLNIGTSGLGSSFDLGVLNMRENEERRIEIKKIDPNLKNIKQKTPYEKKNEMNLENKTFMIVKLNKIIESKKNLEIENFYKNRVKNGKIRSYHILKNLSPEIHCGSPVFLEFKILDESGSEIYNSEEENIDLNGLKNNQAKDSFVFRIGSSMMPPIIEWALNEMHYGDQKIVFLKKSDLKNLAPFVKSQKLKNIIQDGGDSKEKNLIIELNPSLKNF